MSLLRLPSHSVTVPSGRSRRGVTLLSGFLGSGKTTLLRRELSRRGRNPPAVILNDFGRTIVDDVMLTSDGGERPVVLIGGCACCTRRADLARAMADLLDAEQRGDAPRRDHIVIETTGLADPAPIAFTLANDPVLKHHYALDRVCVTVDALTGLTGLEHHEIAFRQLMAADELLVTKADLASRNDVDHLVRGLHELNPSAGVSVTANGELLRAEGAVSARAVTAVAPPPTAVHTAGVSTFELVTDEQVDWQSFTVWLTLLLHSHGPDVLRVKGVLDVRGVGPVALNGVQHIVHPPEHLSRQRLTGTRLVFIVRNIDTNLLQSSLHCFLSIP